MNTQSRRRRSTNTLGNQLKAHAKGKPTRGDFKPYEGDLRHLTSTGSTLLDLAISGGVVQGGGIPSGILVEAFGPSGSGKTVLLCEIAGHIQRKSGRVMFHDPEARLNKQFAKMFDLDVDEMDYGTPDKIPEVFQSLRDWNVDPTNVNVMCTDSLAALSTDLEMKSDEGDKMGMRRAKEFSEELRRSARIIKNKNLLMVASNQVRVNQNAGMYGQKYVTPGGEAIGFYASLRLRFSAPTKIKVKKKFNGKEIEKVVGIETEVEVYKSSIDKPYRKAPLIIYFDYGIDDIRANLQYLKKYTGASTYVLEDDNDPIKLGRSIDQAVQKVEQAGLEKEVKLAVMQLWNEMEEKFKIDRKKKVR